MGTGFIHNSNFGNKIGIAILLIKLRMRLFALQMQRGHREDVDATEDSREGKISVRAHVVHLGRDCLFFDQHCQNVVPGRSGGSLQLEGRGAAQV